MGRLSVWAPRARNILVEIEGKRLEMSQAEGGWWQVESELAEPGADYAFIVDDSKPLPDPRSYRQPFGVHGPSRVLDHNRFTWQDKGWQPPPLSSAIVYELHVGTFTPEGTFQGVEERLDHLIELGITHVELMPVNSFSGSRGWGYDGVDLYAPHESYGGPEGLKHLVNRCHQKGLAVILDVVYNHFGPEGNYLEHFGPYLTERHRSPWGEAVNFDGPESDEVRRFFCDNAAMWFRDYHMDALRIDAVHAIVDTSPTHILEALAAEVEALKTETGRHMALIAESDLNDPRVVRRREIGGYGIDAQWSDDFHHALHTVLTGETAGYYADFGALSQLAKALTSAFVYDGQYSKYRRRRHGRPVEGLSGNRFLGYIQNHDQVGNRATGTRLGHLVSPDRLKIAAVLVFTAPYVPMVFQGEEWAAGTPFQYFTDHQDPGLGEAVKKGRRSEFASFGWEETDIPDPQSQETFERSKLNWEEVGRSPHKEMLEWYRKCIRLRRSMPVLRTGRLDQVRTSFHEQDRWLVMERTLIVVACNLAPFNQTVPLETNASPEVILASDDARPNPHGIFMPPESVAVLVVGGGE